MPRPVLAGLFWLILPTLLCLLDSSPPEGLALEPEKAAAGAPPFLAIQNARVVTIASTGELQVLPRGTVVVRGPRIDAAGEGLPAPEGAETVDGSGQWLLPGFIDAHCLPGLLSADGNEYSRAITEEFQPLDAFDPWDPELERSLRLGVTSLALSPGDRNVVGGRVILVKNLPRQAPPAAVDAPPACKASIGLAVLGGASFPRYPTALSGAFELFSEWLEGKAEKAAAKNQGLVGSEAAAGDRQSVLIHVETRTQMERLLELFKGKPFTPVFVHAQEVSSAGWEMLEDCGPVILGPFDLGDPAYLLKAAAALERRGLALAFASDGTRQDLLTSAVLSMKHGLSLRGALSALTVHPARIFGAGRRLGRIDAGYDADLVLWSGNPFTLNARVEAAWVEGKRVYQAAPPMRKEAP
ncbi:MAG: amidohydrolase family protein [Planctomycetes bacterium]|nr:amidohydrolase family protein [Planctomycetota bacterium]